MKLFEKIKSRDMKLDEAKKYQRMFKSNLSKIVRGRYKSKEQESALQNIKIFCESQESVIKLFNYYSTIAFEANYNTIHGKERRPDVAALL